MARTIRKVGRKSMRRMERSVRKIKRHTRKRKTQPKNRRKIQRSVRRYRMMGGMMAKATDVKDTVEGVKKKIEALQQLDKDNPELRDILEFFNGTGAETEVEVLPINVCCSGFTVPVPILQTESVQDALKKMIKCCILSYDKETTKDMGGMGKDIDTAFEKLFQGEFARVGRDDDLRSLCGLKSPSPEILCTAGDAQRRAFVTYRGEGRSHDQRNLSTFFNSIISPDSKIKHTDVQALLTTGTLHSVFDAGMFSASLSASRTEKLGQLVTDLSKKITDATPGGGDITAATNTVVNQIQSRVGDRGPLNAALTAIGFTGLVTVGTLAAASVLTVGQAATPALVTGYLGFTQGLEYMRSFTTKKEEDVPVCVVSGIPVLTDAGQIKFSPNTLEDDNSSSGTCKGFGPLVKKVVIRGFNERPKNANQHSDHRRGETFGIVDGSPTKRKDASCKNYEEVAAVMKEFGGNYNEFRVGFVFSGDIDRFDSRLPEDWLTVTYTDEAGEKTLELQDSHTPLNVMLRNKHSPKITSDETTGTPYIEFKCVTKLQPANTAMGLHSVQRDRRLPKHTFTVKVSNHDYVQMCYTIGELRYDIYTRLFKELEKRETLFEASTNFSREYRNSMQSCLALQVGLWPIAERVNVQFSTHQDYSGLGFMNDGEVLELCAKLRYIDNCVAVSAQGVSTIFPEYDGYETQIIGGGSDQMNLDTPVDTICKLEAAHEIPTLNFCEALLPLVTQSSEVEESVRDLLVKIKNIVTPTGNPLPPIHEFEDSIEQFERVFSKEMVKWRSNQKDLQQIQPGTPVETTLSTSESQSQMGIDTASIEFDGYFLPANMKGSGWWYTTTEGYEGKIHLHASTGNLSFVHSGLVTPFFEAGTHVNLKYNEPEKQWIEQVPGKEHVLKITIRTPDISGKKIHEKKIYLGFKEVTARSAFVECLGLISNNRNNKEEAVEAAAAEAAAAAAAEAAAAAAAEAAEAAYEPQPEPDLTPDPVVEAAGAAAHPPTPSSDPSTVQTELGFPFRILYQSAIPGDPAYHIVSSIASGLGSSQTFIDMRQAIIDSKPFITYLKNNFGMDQRILFHIYFWKKLDGRVVPEDTTTICGTLIKDGIEVDQTLRDGIDGIIRGTSTPPNLLEIYERLERFIVELNGIDTPEKIALKKEEYALKVETVSQHYSGTSNKLYNCVGVCHHVRRLLDAHGSVLRALVHNPLGDGIAEKETRLCLTCRPRPRPIPRYSTYPSVACLLSLEKRCDSIKKTRDSLTGEKTIGAERLRAILDYEARSLLPEIQQLLKRQHEIRDNPGFATNTRLNDRWEQVAVDYAALLSERPETAATGTGAAAQKMLTLDAQRVPTPKDFSDKFGPPTHLELVAVQIEGAGTPPVIYRYNGNSGVFESE